MAPSRLRACGVLARVVLRNADLAPAIVDAVADRVRRDQRSRLQGRRDKGANVMALLTQSYVHGASVTPLIGETIGALLRRITAEGPEPARPDLPPPERPLDLRRAFASLGGSRRRPSGARPEEGRPGRHLGGQLQRMGARPVRHGACRADPHQHQPGLPGARVRIRGPKIRLPGADPEPRPQVERLFRFAARDRARDRRRRARPRQGGAAAEPRDRHPPRDRDDARACSISTTSRGRRAMPSAWRWRSSARRCSSTTRSTSSSPPAPPASRRARR